MTCLIIGVSGYDQAEYFLRDEPRFARVFKKRTVMFNDTQSSMVLVAGGTGMTGDAVIRRLLQRHPAMRVRGTYHQLPPEWKHDRVEWIAADLQQRNDCIRAVARCGAIVLSAASTGGAAAAASEPFRQMTDNIVMDSYLMEAAHSADVRRFVYLSSATVYQEFFGHIREDQLDFNAEPHVTYLGVGWAKRAAEKFCRFWHEKYGHEIVILRCANVYGPRAKFSPATSNFVPALIRKAVDQLDPFEVWGSADVERDIVFIEDVAVAVDIALHAAIDFEIFNLGTGKLVTVGQVVQYALDAAGHRPKTIVYRQDRPNTIRRRALDCGKICEQLRWTPLVDPAEGIRRTTAWWIANRAIWAR